MGYWFPSIPPAIWVFIFAVLLIFVNSRAVGQLGSVESSLVMIKIAAVVLFVTVGILAVFGFTGDPPTGLRNLTANGGFLPFGAAGVWFGCCFVIYSFIGVEIIAVTSGEASDPSRTIPTAMRRMVVGLSAINVVTIALLVTLTPWNELGVGESPFVSVLRRLHLPAAAGIMNFVVLTAALSSANANLYLIVRTLFSLARAGFAPRSLGAVTHGGTPLPALLVSSAGLGVAVIVQAFWPASGYVWFFSVALFGGLFVWLMIFVTHIAFRAPAVATRSLAGAFLVGAMLISTWWLPGLRSTLLVAGPWLLTLAVGYRLSAVRAASRSPAADGV
jgi:L-asparagine transporter-like permease